MAVKTETMSINPQLAAKWLQAATNYDNRRMREQSVNGLAEQMLAGKWQLTHQGIAFSVQGRLLDGQHRLAAIVRSGVTVKMLVSSGLPDETFKVMDTTTPRAIFDRIHLVDNPAQNELMCTCIQVYLKAVRKVSGKCPASTAEDEYLDKSESWDWVGAEFTPKPANITLAAVLAALAVYRHTDHAGAEQFCAQYKTGANLPLGSPALILRNAVLCKASVAVTYWHAVWAMDRHRNGIIGTSMTRLIPASEDFLGAKSVQLLYRRARNAAAGVETKKARERMPA